MIKVFNFSPGRQIAGKYRIESFLGSGWEGEVYLIRELETGIERTAKFFFPHRNIDNATAKRNAQKLFKFRANPVMIQYITQETITFQGERVRCLISDFVDGEILEDFLKRQPQKKIHHFMALHILYSIATGLEPIHSGGDYHGDLHTGNVFIKQSGIDFQIKLIDPFDWQDSKRENIKKETVDLIKIFYEILGGAKTYASQPVEIKKICCGLKASLIHKKFRNAGQLCRYLETMTWLSQ
jgi:tRNA A-37 threonylcarbamoyl transferase component Bud32